MEIDKKTETVAPAYTFNRTRAESRNADEGWGMYYFLIFTFWKRKSKSTFHTYYDEFTN